MTCFPVDIEDMIVELILGGLVGLVDYFGDRNLCVLIEVFKLNCKFVIKDFLKFTNAKKLWFDAR